MLLKWIVKHTGTWLFIFHKTACISLAAVSSVRTVFACDAVQSIVFDRDHRTSAPCQTEHCSEKSKLIARIKKNLIFELCLYSGVSAGYLIANVLCQLGALYCRSLWVVINRAQTACGLYDINLGYCSYNLI